MKSVLVPKSQAWMQEQVGEFGRVRHRYQKLADFLEKLLKEARDEFSPAAIIETRAKSIASFAEKIQRKDYLDPVRELTDMCGGRIITTTQKELAAACQFVSDHFVIHEYENTATRLKPQQFGYRSIHYIVSLKPGMFHLNDITIRVPALLCPDARCPMRAEIQVRTIFEHAFADPTHDRSYKSVFKLPERWEREIAEVAAGLEVTASSIERIIEGLSAYAANYGDYMLHAQTMDEINRLKTVLRFDPKNTALVARIGRLLFTIEEWDEAIQLLSSYQRHKDPAVLQGLGLALCKKYALKRNHPQYRAGRKLLEKAVALSPKDCDGLCILASKWRGVDDRRARQLYQQAYEVDPTYPYALSGFLVEEIVRTRSTRIVTLMRPTIESSMIRCQEWTEVQMNMPWAHYNLAIFHLLLGDPFASLAAMAKALQLTSAPFMVESIRSALERLAVVGDELPGYEWVLRLGVAGVVACHWKLVRDAGRARDEATIALAQADAKLTGLKKGSREISEVSEARRKALVARKQAMERFTNHSRELAIVRRRAFGSNTLAKIGRGRIKPPVVIVAGGCGFLPKTHTRRYRKLLLGGLQNYQGTLISGGTTAGIAGFVAEAGKRSKGAIHTIGYIPHGLPKDGKPDRRYCELRRTNGNGFTPLEPIQNWLDILASENDPAEVKLFGINGGKVSAVEFRVALALGATVAILEGSGREAAKLKGDADWVTAKNLIFLPEDTLTIESYISSGSQKQDVAIREIMGKQIHEEYVQSQIKAYPRKEPNLSEWAFLREDFKESNRQQADHAFEKLRQIGREVIKIDPAIRDVAIAKFSEPEIDTMARMEHARWNAERLLEGWKYGPEKDAINRISPYLVSWDKLPDSVKEWDREAVRNIPHCLAKVGFEIILSRQ